MKQMKQFKVIAVIFTVLLGVMIFSGCSQTAPPADTTTGGDTTATTPATPSGQPTSIKIGILNPTTGPLAGMGEGTPFLDDYFKDYINNTLGGIKMSDYDSPLPVETVLYDTESNPDKVSDLTTKLITDDKVNIIITRHTPDTVVPATVVAEQYGVPCIAMDCPSGAWLGQGDHKWSFLAHTSAQSYWDAYSSIWEAAGYKAGDANATLGWVFADDLDGTTLSPDYAACATAAGYKMLDPGLYASGTNDYSSLIKQFKDANIEVVFGVMNNPEFATFWTQCLQNNFKPKVVVIGKAFMLESQAMAIGATLMDGICNEVWWDVHFPYTSSLMGWTCMQYGDWYNQQTGLTAASPQGAKLASWEILIDALNRSANVDPDSIRQALLATDLDTIMGHINYTTTDNPNYCPLACVGGQWILQPDGSLKQEIVGNPDPSNGIPITAPIKTSGFAWDK